MTIRFNSTLVRLQLDSGMKGYPELHCFNSTLVRLQLTYFHSLHWKERVSIPHWFDYSPDKTRRDSIALYVSIPHWFDYSVLFVEYVTSSHHRFNSTLVRLQPSSSLRIAAKYFWFQFHTGSITARTIFSPGPANNLFQFHTGSITALCEERLWDDPWMFQFHTGSITAMLQKQCLIRLLGFNSTLVRLQRIPGQGYNIWPFCFNSTLVRLQLARKVKRLNPYRAVSIPHWFDYSYSGR